ncbi:MAG: hypothetical protein NT024_12020, partial [Proteobacteria bacterium]|nr:hypothetical protein [Pseudomonadota bacterium]
ATTVQAMSASRSAIAAASVDSPRSIDRSITNTLRRRSIHAIRALHPGCANRLFMWRTASEMSAGFLSLLRRAKATPDCEAE